MLIRRIRTNEATTEKAFLACAIFYVTVNSSWAISVHLCLSFLAITISFNLKNSLYSTFFHTGEKTYMLLSPEGKPLVVVISLVKDNHAVGYQFETL